MGETKELAPSGLVWFDFVVMKTYTITEGKAQLSALVERVLETGEPVVLGRAGRPMVELVPYRGAPQGKRIGCFHGQVRMHKDFDHWDGDEARAFGLED